MKILADAKVLKLLVLYNFLKLMDNLIFYLEIYIEVQTI